MPIVTVSNANIIDNREPIALKISSRFRSIYIDYFKYYQHDLFKKFCPHNEYEFDRDVITTAEEMQELLQLSK